MLNNQNSFHMEPTYDWDTKRIRREDLNRFWFRDDLHTPYPVTPMAASLFNRHHDWGYQYTSLNEFQHPKTYGISVKTYMGRVYFGPILVPEEESEERKKEFEKRLKYFSENWDNIYSKYVSKMDNNLKRVLDWDIENASYSEIFDYLRELEMIQREHWVIHFTLMYPVYTFYLAFEEYCSNHGIDEQEFTQFLKGFSHKMKDTDKRLWDLTKLAWTKGLRELFLETDDPTELLEKLEKTENGKEWIKELNDFLNEFGLRSQAAVFDYIYPSWKEDPTPVLTEIKNNLRKDQPLDIEEEWDKTVKSREESIKKALKKIPEEERDRFLKFLNLIQRMYIFNEDHNFYIEQGTTSIVRLVLLKVGKRLVDVGILKNEEDVFFLTFQELLWIIDDLSKDEKTGIFYWRLDAPPIIEDRKFTWKKLHEVETPLFMGNVPDTIEDPILIKIMGITTDVLRRWKTKEEVAEVIRGFPGSPGVVEGTARVVTSFSHLERVKPGEILVCPYTSPAWTAIFPRIKGVVTDSGGMLTHAAITAREYGIPAVVGTWNATKKIKDGQKIRVDGDNGVVEIIKE